MRFRKKYKNKRFSKSKRSYKKRSKRSKRIYSYGSSRGGIRL